MSRKKHVHKYHKVHIYSTNTWACALPDCTHYLPNGMQSTVIGKSSICWECGEQFILTPNSLQNDRPTCSQCDIPDDALAAISKLISDK